MGLGLACFILIGEISFLVCFWIDLIFNFLWKTFLYDIAKEKYNDILYDDYLQHKKNIKYHLKPYKGFQKLCIFHL